MKADIGPYTYSIRFRKEPGKALGKNKGGLPKDLYGLTINGEQLIYISNRHSKKVQQDTLVHELLHAAWFASGLGSLHHPSEEETVSILAPMVLQALQSNQELRDFLLDDQV